MKNAKNDEFGVGSRSNMWDDTAREDPKNDVIGEFPSGKLGIQQRWMFCQTSVLLYGKPDPWKQRSTFVIAGKKRTGNQTGNRTHGKAALGPKHRN